MKTILVPVDFSGNSNTAYEYATTLARKLHSRVILFHACQVPAPVAEVPFGVLNEEALQLKAEANVRLRSLWAGLPEADRAYHEYFSADGEAVDAILHAAKENNAELIIMGASDANNLGSIVFGSTTLKVMEKAHCPVIAIPGDLVISKTIKRITFATDYHQSDLAAIHVAAEIAGASNAQLNVLHICDAVIGADEEKTLMHNFMEKVKIGTVYPNLSFQVIHGYNVEERLQQYIDEDSTDMLMMATHYRSIFDRIFGGSITKDFARNATIPVVAFHYNSTTAVKLF